MYIDKSEIKNTKIMVSKRDINAVQKVLFKCGYGYLQGLGLDSTLRTYKTDCAVYVNYAGEIEVVEKGEYDDEMHFYTDFKQQPEEEISWEALF